MAMGTLAGLAGCYPMYPYQQPGAWPPPGQPAYAPPPAIPRSTYVMPGDISSAPATTLGSPAPITPASPSVQQPDDSPEQAVPEPRDPAAKVEPTGKKTSSLPAETGTFGLPTTSQQRLAVTELPRMADSSTNEFQKPVIRSDSSPARGVVAVSHQETPDLSQLGHDPSHRWFRGVVEYDPQGRSWHLLYDLNPALTDQLGGDITLDGAHGLKPSDSGSVVRVYGSFNPARLDSLGKMVYSVSRLESAPARK